MPNWWQRIIEAGINPGRVGGEAGVAAGEAIAKGENPLGSTGGDKFLGEFQATAYGPPWDAMNGTGITSRGTNLQGQNGVGKYIVAVDPSVISYGTKLKVSPNPFGDENIVFLADDTGGAFHGGVKHIDIFDWRGRQSQLRWGSRRVKVWETDSPAGIIGTGQKVVEGASDTADFVGDFVGTVLNFRKMGELSAKIFAWFLRLVFKAIWDYVIAPLFHWNERAVMYYWQRYYGSKESGGDFAHQNGGVITLLFWSMGAAILWLKAENGPGVATTPHQTMLGRTVRSTESQIARRKLVKPSKVKEKTPTKPKPTTSAVPIEHTQTFETTRKRPIKVGTSGSSERFGRPENPPPEQKETGVLLPPGVQA